MHARILSIAFACVLLVVAAGGCPKPTRPTAAFTADIVSGDTPLEVHFTEQCQAGSSAITSYAWDFGDGGTSSAANPSHTYAAPGLYTVSLTVASSVGSDTESKPGYIAVTAEDSLFVPGTNVELVSETVDEYGAELSGPTGTPLEGVIVRIPPAMFDDDTSVTAGYETGVLLPVEGEAAGPIVTVDIGTDDMVDQPIEIVIPCPLVPGGTQVPVPYCIDEDEHLFPVELAEIDEEAGAVTLLTYHGGRYALIVTDEDVFDTPGAKAGVPLFAAGNDGFQIGNDGSAVNRQGECLGMTMWALWYYLNHREDGTFFSRYMFTVPPYGLTGQDIIATRAFTSVTQMRWLNIGRSLMLYSRSHKKNAVAIRNAMRNSPGKPVLLTLLTDAKADEKSNGHSVLAYDYRINPGQQPRFQVDIYDPNYPGVPKMIKFNSDTGAWDYETYQWASYYGSGSLRVKESYEYILQDANNQFHSSSDAVVTVTSHHHNDEVPYRVTTLQGTIESGEVAVTELEVWVNSESYKTSVSYDGQFYLDIPLQYGKNYLKFITRGQDAYGNERLVGNNMFMQEFVLKGTFPLAVIRVELIWGKPGTDVDLYVYDPTGDVSWYADKITNDGGELDYDDRYTCGPEHWTLTTTDTVRWDQEYRVRLHYFRDNGNGPTSYKVTVVLFEGELYETTRVFEGTVSTSDPQNGDPAGTGSDWRDVVSVTPPGPKSRGPAIRAPEPGEPFYVRATARSVSAAK